MNNEKLKKELETKIENGELKNKEELENHLTELKYRGILTQMHINSLMLELSNLCETKKTGSSKRVTRTPQNRYF